MLMTGPADEFEFPPGSVIASHHLHIGEVGRVRASYLISVDDPDVTVTVLSLGHISRAPVVRIQSRCLFGEIYRSPECDCEEQLWTSLRRMFGEGSGLLIHLDQDGRGAGIRAKAKAYEYAEREGIDPFGAYGHLGLEHDLRSYSDAVRVFELLEIKACTLLTNNPAKIAALRDAGIVTYRKPLWVPSARRNVAYVQAKRREGHLG